MTSPSHNKPDEEPAQEPEESRVQPLPESEDSLPGEEMQSTPVIINR